MTVADSNGYAHTPRQLDVTVHEIIWTVAPQDTQESAGLGQRSAMVKAGDEPGPESTNLFVVDTRLVCMDEEIHSVSLSVDVPQDIHEPRLDPTRVHSPDHTENPDRHSIQPRRSADRQR